MLLFAILLGQDGGAPKWRFLLRGRVGHFLNQRVIRSIRQQGIFTFEFTIRYQLHIHYIGIIYTIHWSYGHDIGFSLFSQPVFWWNVFFPAFDVGLVYWIPNFAEISFGLAEQTTKYTAKTWQVSLKGVTISKEFVVSILKCLKGVYLSLLNRDYKVGPYQL